MPVTRFQNKLNQRLGEGAEIIIGRILECMGVCEIEKIETGWNIRRKGPKVISAYPRKKVAGDLRGILSPSGISVLVEVKRRPAKLSYGDFKPHQLAKLNSHAKCGGVSLIGWVSDRGSFVIPHAIEGWGKGSPLTIEQARALNIAALSDLKRLGRAKPRQS